MGYDPARSGRSSKPREPARVPRTRAAPPRPVRRFVGRAAPTRRGRLWLEARHAPPSHARRPQGTARGSARARSGNRGSPCSRFRVRSRRRVSDDPPRHPVPRVLGKGATTGGPGIDRDHPHHGDAFFRRGGVAEVAAEGSSPRRNAFTGQDARARRLASAAVSRISLNYTVTPERQNLGRSRPLAI